MGQDEAFQNPANIHRINNNNSKKNNFIEYPPQKSLLKPNKSMFEFLYVVGRGGFGKVWMVRYKKTREKYALKEMSKVKIIDRKSEKSIKNEREFLSKLHHPFIVNMICSFQDYDNLYLVMDLLTGGDLRYHICHKKQFNEEQSRFFSSCILLALEYIHMNNIIHRDIKPENLVLDEKGYVRITDFGVAKKNTRDNSSETSGTPGYMAPEVLCGLNHSFSVDFFALGVIIFEFMNGYRPYLGRNRKEIKEAVLARPIHVHRKQLFENGWSFESGDLINKLLYRKPHKRLGCNGINEIKEHSWFKNINWDELLNKKMKSPFVPKDGDNFDKRYCESVEHIDTQTKERYQYYKSKSKFKTLFLNYTFIRDEDKQEYENDTNNNNDIIHNNNSMTNIHSINLLNGKNNRNKSVNSYFNQLDKENNDGNSNMGYNNIESDIQNQKIFSRTFKLPKNNMINNNYFSDINNEIVHHNNNNIENFNHLNYFKEKAKENNQIRSSSTLIKRQNEYYSINNNNNKLNNKIKSSENSQYYDFDNYNNNNNITSIKININAPISINKYKYNRSSSQKNIFSDIKGIKNNQGKLIKYINIDEEMDEKTQKLQRANKNRYKNNNNSNGIYINPSQFIYYPSHRSNNISTNNLSITLKKNANKYNNEEYLMYKTSRNFFDRNKKLKSENYQEEISNNINKPRINNNNININFNINNINNNINNINQINSDNFNNNTNLTNLTNIRNKASKVKGAQKNYYNNASQRKYIYSNNNMNSNNNILVVKSSLSNNVNNSSQLVHYSKNKMLIECDGYEPFMNNIESNMNSNINKNKTLSKASSMKSFGNNIYYNIEMKKSYKKSNINNNNTPLRKQKTEKVINNNSNNNIKVGGIMSNGWQNQNKYLFFKNHS